MDPYDNDQYKNNPWGEPEPQPADDRLDPTLPVSDPGFGHAANPSVSEPVSPAPAQQRLDSDVICTHCGYNLRGQLPSGSCPECGAAVALSLRSDQLNQADPVWLGKLKNGMTWMVAGVIFYVLFIVVIMVAAIALMPSMAPGPGQPGAFNPGLGFNVLAVVGALIYVALFTVAYWLITEPEPGVANPPATCAIARWTLIPALIISAVASFIGVSQTEAAQIISGVLQIISLLLILVGFPASMIYKRHLARRIPNPGLARQTSIVLWGMMISMGGFVVGLVLAVLVGGIAATSGSGSPSQVAAGIGLLMLVVFCPAMLGLLVFSIWWIVLVCLYRSQFAYAQENATRQYVAKSSSAYAMGRP